MAHPLSLRNEQSSKSSNSTDRSAREITFLTLFPELIDAFMRSSILGRALEAQLLTYRAIQIRDFAEGRYSSVDDTPFGGGPGMLMRADVLFRAWQSVVGDAREEFHTVLLSPQGEVFNHAQAKTLATRPRLIFVCGHYEGVDERFVSQCVDQEISIGDYVLTGGEMPALVLADAIGRFVPGVVGKQESVDQDSFENGRLKFPQYTRPREFMGVGVPEVLLSGDHAKIEKWRLTESVKRTAERRPDLIP